MYIIYINRHSNPHPSVDLNRHHHLSLDAFRLVELWPRRVSERPFVAEHRPRLLAEVGR